MQLGAAHAVMLGAALFAASPAHARADENAPLQPFQMVRSLQLVQDRIADGDHAALPMQKKLLELIDKRLRTAEADDFEDRRNYRSLLIYAMSGGNPSTLDVVRSKLKLEPPDKAMVEAISSYLKGRSQRARVAFAQVDPMAQTADLGAFLALVKGSLEAGDKPDDALALFDKARLLGSGTLVEEAALRRSIALATSLNDAKRFQLWSSQYVRRFLRSPYASQFADAFVNGVVALHETVDYAAVEDIVAGMEEEQRKVIYLRLARRGAIEGLADVSAFAAKHVESQDVVANATEKAAEEDPRAMLYASLSKVRAGDLDDVKAQLDRIDRARLSERDRQLLDAVRLVASQVTAPVAPIEKAAPKDDAPAPAEPKASAEIARAEERAKAEGSLTDLVPTDDLAVEAPVEPAAATPVRRVDTAAAEAEAVADTPLPTPLPEQAPRNSAEAGHEPAEAGHGNASAEAADDAGAPKAIDETTTAAAETAKGARDKLDAIDKLMQENADK